MRATLTDDGCAYEGDTTHAPGLFSVEVENKSSHFASFALYPLAAGKNVEDVQLAYDILVDPRRGRYVRGTSDRLFVYPPPLGHSSATFEVAPEATSALPLNASSGRFVILCHVYTTGNHSVSPGQPLPPTVVLVVPVEVEVR